MIFFMTDLSFLYSFRAFIIRKFERAPKMGE